jgi:hypothetical protein
MRCAVISRTSCGASAGYELPNLHALQFVCERALDTGVTTSLALDPHGKSLSYALLELTIEAVA